MKKRISKILGLSILTIALFAGCGKTETRDLTLKDGILTWDKVENAIKYEVDLGSGGEIITGNSYDLTEKCDSTGKFSIKVYSLSSSGEKTEIGQKDITVKNLDEPAVTVKKDDDNSYFVWSEVEGAKSYSYDAHDGKGIQTLEAGQKEYKVLIERDSLQMIDVTAEGTSEGDNIYTDSSTTYSYTKGEGFDMSLLAKYQAVYTAGDNNEGQLKIGTTLTKGVYELELQMYVMDSKGYKLTGNGVWGRRVQDVDLKFSWFCEKETEGFKESANTLTAPNQIYKTKMKLAVDRGGNVILPIYDFKQGEKLVVASVKYNGKNVLNDKGGKSNKVPEIKMFDITSLDKYLAVFKSKAKYYADDPENSELWIPTKLSDGNYTVRIRYYVCKGNGDMLEGNGLWGRRIAGNDENVPITWLNEYDLDGHSAVEIPLPTEEQKMVVGITVKNGKFRIIPLDFGESELLIVSGVDTSSVQKKNGTFVSTGAAKEEFEVATTLTGKPRHADVTLQVTYKVSNVFGDDITGNGAWGRRMKVGETHYWLCEEGVDNFPEAANTLKPAGKLITEDMFFYEINKFGIMTINMYDFAEGDMVQIVSVKYNGKEVLKK